MKVFRILEQMRDPVVQLLSSKSLRQLAQSLGPYCLAAAILSGGIVLVPLFLLFRRRKAALEAVMVRESCHLLTAKVADPVLIHSGCHEHQPRFVLSAEVWRDM